MSRRPIQRIELLVLMVVASAFTQAHGCQSDEPLRPSVTAVAMLLEHEDGAVVADLWLWSPPIGVQPAVGVSDASGLRVSTPSDPLATLLPLKTGHYSGELPGDYAPDAPVVFAFALDEEVAERHALQSGAFSLTLPAPGEQPDVWWGEPPSEGMRLDWSPSSLRALVQVLDDAGAVVWTNFDVAAAEFGLATWHGLGSAGSTLIGVQLDPGTAVRLCAVDVARAAYGAAHAQPLHDGGHTSSGLSAASGVIVGRCVTTIVPG